MTAMTTDATPARRPADRPNGSRSGCRGPAAEAGSGAAPLKNNHYQLLQLVLFWAGAILLPLGLVVIVLGWYGAANTPYQYDQLSYLVSGGLLGLGLTFIGGFLYFGAWLARIADDGRESSRAAGRHPAGARRRHLAGRDHPRRRRRRLGAAGHRRRRHHDPPPRLRADRAPRRPAPGRRGQRRPHRLPGLPALSPVTGLDSGRRRQRRRGGAGSSGVRGSTLSM